MRKAFNTMSGAYFQADIRDAERRSLNGQHSAGSVYTWFFMNLRRRIC